MKILLLEDIDNLGQAGDVLNVADGYGRNFLLPRKLAKVATAGSLKETEQIRRAGERKRDREMGAATDLARQIDGITITFRARAGETGKLYGSITTGDLAEALEKEIDQEVDRRKIVTEPLRQLGEQTIEIRLMTDVTARFTAIVEPEGELEPERLPEEEYEEINPEEEEPIPKAQQEA